ncbi:SDR family NAD(P)-dependent oxidoreductase [Cellulophaga sp. 20_2_10]|uniref:SDR family NAD(P)-dependent oxidoreductase n=1 Tax=Cellulophaga sp. 20_2_10 TaxID=2942476 RepID=UPI00201A71D4|nr:SDR family NAD(P)-dependent oxidoreductase [Cellulophaga sp. 20_2_10]MCL5247296.1 SDR family NAD(P)-dependent oxidoreductase [Cellulophaga sp. 20_2_10]
MKSIIISGATSGIGKALVEALILKGNYKIGIIGRNQEKLKDLTKSNNAESNQIFTYKADLSSLKETKKIAKEILLDFNEIDFLINNAGVYLYEKEITPEGFEKTLVTNYLSTFLLNKILVPILVETASKKGGAQIINTGSSGHKRPVNWGDLNFENTAYDGPFVYEHSKHLIISHTFNLAKQLQNTNVRVNTIHPGFVTSGLIKGKKMPFPMNILTKILPIFMGITPEKAKETYLWLLFNEEAKQLNATYIDNKKVTKVWPPIRDEKAQERLRIESEGLISNFL